MSLLSMKYFICSHSFLSPYCVYSIHRNYDGANATSITTDTSCYSRSSIRNRLQTTYNIPDSIQNRHFFSWNNTDSLWNTPFSNRNTDYSRRNTNNTIYYTPCSNYYWQYSNWNRTSSNWNRQDSICNRQYSKWNRQYTTWNGNYSTWYCSYSRRHKTDNSSYTQYLFNIFNFSCSNLNQLTR